MEQGIRGASSQQRILHTEGTPSTSRLAGAIVAGSAGYQAAHAAHGAVGGQRRAGSSVQLGSRLRGGLDGNRQRLHDGHGRGAPRGQGGKGSL